MLLATEFRQLLNTMGEPAEVHMAKPPKTVTKTTAIVQSVKSNSKAHESIVQAYGVDGKSFQFAAADVVPSRLDQIVLATGERYTIDSVVKHFERGSGALSSVTAYVKGR